LFTFRVDEPEVRAAPSGKYRVSALFCDFRRVPRWIAMQF
jgi:hypothetical protein